MRILNQDSDQSVNNVILYLTSSEALELSGAFQNLLKHPKGNHAHISSQDYSKEVTVCIYDSEKLDGFDERSKKIITTDQ